MQFDRQFASARVSTLSIRKKAYRFLDVSSKWIYYRSLAAFGWPLLIAVSGVCGFEANSLFAQAPVSFKEQIAPILQ